MENISLLRNQHRLILAVSQHARVGVVGHVVQMGWYLVLLFATVQVDHLHGVDGQALVRVDGHAKQARVGLLKNQLLRNILYSVLSEITFIRI